MKNLKIKIVKNKKDPDKRDYYAKKNEKKVLKQNFIRNGISN